MISLRLKGRQLSWLLLGAAFVACGGQLAAQTITGYDGEFENLRPGISYSITPIPNTIDLSISPSGDSEWGIPMHFVLSADSGTVLTVKFDLPHRLFPSGGTGNGFISNTFSANSGYILEDDKYFHPESTIQIQIGRERGRTIVLGMTAVVSSTVGPDAYEGQSTIYATSNSGDSIATASSHCLVNIGMFYGPYPAQADMKISNLNKGFEYVLDPDANALAGLDPKISGNEIGHPGVYSVLGDLNASVLVSFLLPAHLTSPNGSDSIECLFSESSCLWLDSMRYIDPRTDTRITLNNDGVATLALGIKLRVPHSTVDESFEGEVLVMAQYTGLKISPASRRASPADLPLIPWPLHIVVDLNRELPRSITLSQNFPNPFNPGTMIRYQVPQDMQTILKVYNLYGQEIETLVNERETAGYHVVEWNPKNLPSGIYYYRISSGGYTETKRMIYLK